MDFEIFDAKNFIFSIFFKLFHILYNDVKTVPRCFATLKASPKASEHILGSFEKAFFSSTFQPLEAFFCLWSWPTLWKWHFMRVFKTYRLFPDENNGLNMLGEASSDHFATFCWADLVSMSSCWKDQFWIFVPLKIHSNLCFWSCFPLFLHGFERILGGAKVQNWFFSAKSF